jgi:hypothetical protein
MTSPVIQRASSEARKTATGPMSSGSPIRPSGIWATVAASASVPMKPAERAPSVSVPPGAMALTRMPRGASSNHIGEEPRPSRPMDAMLFADSEAGVFEQSLQLRRPRMVRSDVHAAGDETSQRETSRRAESRDGRQPSRRKYPVEFPQGRGLVEELKRRSRHDRLQGAIVERQPIGRTGQPINLCRSRLGLGLGLGEHACRQVHTVHLSCLRFVFDTICENSGAAADVGDHRRRIRCVEQGDHLVLRWEINPALEVSEVVGRGRENSRNVKVSCCPVVVVLS